MALNLEELKSFTKALHKASKELNSTKLVYKKEWIFLYPSHSLSIGKEMLHSKYKIPTGFDGFGQGDLERLVEFGCLTLEKITKGDADLLEEEQVYSINRY